MESGHDDESAHQDSRGQGRLHATTKTGIIESIYYLCIFSFYLVFTVEEESLFTQRYNNGYDLTIDSRYNQWLKVKHGKENYVIGTMVMYLINVVLVLSVCVNTIFLYFYNRFRLFTRVYNLLCATFTPDAPMSKLAKYLKIPVLPVPKKAKNVH